MEVPSALMLLVNGVKTLFLSSNFSDLTVICQGRSWEVHKAILSCHSDYFRKQCLGDLKVSSFCFGVAISEDTTSQEAQEAKIELNEDDPLVVEGFLYYMYNFDYGDHGNSQDHVTAIVLNVRMFALADKYFIEPPKTLSADKFEERAAAEWQTAAPASSIAEIYSIILHHEPRLKNIVLHEVNNHRPELLSQSHGFKEFHEVMRNNAAFTADVSEYLTMDKHTTSKTSRYSSHGEVFTVDVPEGVCFRCPSGCYTNQDTILVGKLRRTMKC